MLPSRNSKYDLVDNSDTFDTSVEEQVCMWGVAMRAERKCILKSVLELLLLAVYCDFTVWFEYLQ
jgi:hypothetical protein